MLFSVLSHIINYLRCVSACATDLEHRFVSHAAEAKMLNQIVIELSRRDEPVGENVAKTAEQGVLVLQTRMVCVYCILRRTSTV